jgi:hypothetical protein
MNIVRLLKANEIKIPKYGIFMISHREDKIKEQ